MVLPLLRHPNVQTRPASILKWEAIVNDPTGALCAVIAYEYFRKVAESPGASVIEVVPPLIIAAIIAGLIGYAAARLIAYLFPRGAIPEYLKVPVLFITVIGVFVLANTIEHEAGLVAVTVMGVALANMNVSSYALSTRSKRMWRFLLVSGIFISCSRPRSTGANCPISIPRGEAGLRSILFLVALLFLVRPLTVIISLLGSSVPGTSDSSSPGLRRAVSCLSPSQASLRCVWRTLAMTTGMSLIGLSFAVVVATIVAHGFTIDLARAFSTSKGRAVRGCSSSVLRRGALRSPRRCRRSKRRSSSSTRAGSA